jgi:hypothetical protein
MRAIDAAHGTVTGILLSPLGAGGTGGLHITLVSNVPVAGAGPECEAIMGESDYPCKCHRDLWSHIFDGLYKHDYTIGKQYNQRSLLDA